MKRLLEINKEIHIEENRVAEKSWPSWSGKMYDALQKLINHPTYSSIKPLQNMFKEVQEIAPGPELHKQIEKLISWIDKEKVRVIGRIQELNSSRHRFEAEINVTIHEGIQLTTKDIESINTRIGEKNELLQITNDDLETTRFSIEKHENEWRTCLSQLPDNINYNDNPISKTSLNKLLKVIKDWEKGSANVLETAKRWGGIRKDWLDSIENPTPEILEDLQATYQELINIEGVTLSFCAKWEWYQKYISDPFDIVIIDEVSKATPPELLQALLLGKHIVLIGDHKQLPPTFSHHQEIKDPDFEETAREIEDPEILKRFEKMVTSSLFKEMFINADESIKQILNIQYRMHNHIMKCTNTFYNWTLENGLGEDEQKTKKAHGIRIVKSTSWASLQPGSDLITPEKHALWIDSSFNRKNEYQSEMQLGSSKANIRELEIARTILNQINMAVEEQKKKLAPEDWKNDPMLQHLNDVGRLPVGFITFYGAQIAKYKEIVLENKGWETSQTKWPNLIVKVNSVDRFQGGERPIVIVSTVVSNKIAEETKNRYLDIKTQTPKSFRLPRREGGIPMPTTGFVKSFERINVAISRAQNLLIIIGNRWGLEKVIVRIPNDDKKSEFSIPIYKNIQKIISENGGILDGREFI